MQRSGNSESAYARIKDADGGSHRGLRTKRRPAVQRGANGCLKALGARFTAGMDAFPVIECPFEVAQFLAVGEMPSVPRSVERLGDWIKGGRIQSLGGTVREFERRIPGGALHTARLFSLHDACEECVHRLAPQPVTGQAR